MEEINLNTLKLKQLATDRGLDIVESSIKINESGVDFQVVHAKDQHGDKWILRIPRRPESMRHAGQEKKALDILHQQASFQGMRDQCQENYTFATRCWPPPL